MSGFRWSLYPNATYRRETGQKYVPRCDRPNFQYTDVSSRLSKNKLKNINKNQFLSTNKPKNNYFWGWMRGVLLKESDPFFPVILFEYLFSDQKNSFKCDYR